MWDRCGSGRSSHIHGTCASTSHGGAHSSWACMSFLSACARPPFPWWSLPSDASCACHGLFLPPISLVEQSPDEAPLPLSLQAEVFDYLDGLGVAEGPSHGHLRLRLPLGTSYRQNSVLKGALDMTRIGLPLRKSLRIALTALFSAARRVPPSERTLWRR